MYNFDRLEGRDPGQVVAVPQRNRLGLGELGVKLRRRPLTPEEHQVLTRDVEERRQQVQERVANQ